jgi:hypothetical protein
VGGKRHDRAQWLQRVRRWKASGLTCKEFSKRERIKPRTLSWWAWRLRSDGESVDRKPSGKKKRRAKQPEHAPKSAELAFVELMPVASDERIEIEVGDVTVRVPKDFDVETLVRIFAAMERRG